MDDNTNTNAEAEAGAVENSTENKTPEVDASKGNEADSSTDWKAEAEKYKSIAAKWESRSKQNFDKASTLDEVSERLQKLEEHNAQIKQENDTLKRSSIGLKYGLPEKVIERLAGSTEEELENDAKEWQGILKVQEAAESKDTNRAKPVRSQGSGEDTSVENVKKAKTLEEFLALKKTL